MSWSTLYWQNEGLLLLLLLPLLFGFFNYLQQKTHWRKIAEPHLLPWLRLKQKKSNSLVSLVFLTLSWLLLVIALAGPRTVDWLPPDVKIQSASLIVVIDFSASMNARDAYPSRKLQAITWLQQALKNKPPSLKIGFVLFSGHAFVLMTPTKEDGIIAHFSEQLTEISLPTLGNDLPAAITLARQQFIPSDDAQRILVLTDGDLSSSEQSKTESTITPNKHNEYVSFLGFGGNKAVKIPKKDHQFVQHDGRPVQSRLANTWFKNISAIKQVFYSHVLDVKNLTLSQLIQLPTPRLDAQSQQKIVWHELFSVPLLLGLACFIMSLWSTNIKTASQLILSFFIINIALIASPSAEAESIFNTAKKALSQKQYSKAEQLFKNIDSPLAAYGEGIACYRQDDFNCATRAFSQSAWQASTQNLRALAVFNLANSYFYLGEYDQASVLYEDAKNLGFDKPSANRNLQFSNTMQQALLQQINDIKDTFRHAKWRAAINGHAAPNLSDIVSTQNNLSLPTDKHSRQFQIRRALALKVNQQLGFKSDANGGSSQWIRTEQISNQSTAALLKRLFEMELAIPAPLKEPETIKGKRPW